MDRDNEGRPPTQAFILAHNRNKTKDIEDMISSQLCTTQATEIHEKLRFPEKIFILHFEIQELLACFRFTVVSKPRKAMTRKF